MLLVLLVDVLFGVEILAVSPQKVWFLSLRRRFVFEGSPQCLGRKPRNYGVFKGRG